MIEGVLGRIVERKRADVAARLDGVGIDRLRAEAPLTRRSLAAALKKPGARFIMEVKRVSPSEGMLHEGADPAAIARAYRCAADAISVLTDTPFFGGSFEDLRAVRAEFDGPILAKDFVIDPRQVPEARLHGADAVLAMLSVLSDAEAAEVMAEARRLGMDVLVEAHDEEELCRAIALGAPIIGINNRDLKTLKVDLTTTERLAGMVPKDRILVSESGIADAGDIERLGAHVDAFLVGSSLMKSLDPAAAARALAFGRVKVCGITNPDDLALSSFNGASYAGVILVPGTPRAVSLAQAQELAGAAAGLRLPLVGVFRDAPASEVAEAAQALGLAAVQLHGSEDAGYIASLRPLLAPGVEIWAAGAVGHDLPEPRAGADRLLFDTKVGGQSGGTGVAFEWSRLRDRPELSSSILAGGLNPGNARAARAVGSFALDVSSGVEAAPGRKDPDKLKAFFEALRAPVRGETKTC